MEHFEQGKNIGSLDVLFGRVFARVKGVFSVENRNVVAGVEGTEFAFEVGLDGDTEITVLDGTVLSSSKKLPWKPLRVTRNQAFWVTSSGMQIKVGAAPALIHHGSKARDLAPLGLSEWGEQLFGHVAFLAGGDH